MGLFFLMPHPIPGFPHGLLKFDFDAWQIHFFGVTLVPGLFHILSLFIMWILLTIALISSFFSKVFCGWICPQNTFYELFEGAIKSLSKRFPRFRRSKRAQNRLDLALSLFFGLAVASTVLLYFKGAHPLFKTLSFIGVFTFFSFDTHKLKHKFCHSACPYAFLQKSLQNTQSMHVAWEETRENKPCTSCRACEVACYVDLDVKKDAFDIDCTMCGACIDACARVYSRRSEPPLLQFSTGKKTLFQWCLAIGYVIYSTFFIYQVVERPTVSFRIATPMGGSSISDLPIEKDSHSTNTFWVRTRNLSSKPLSLRLSMEPAQYQDMFSWESDQLAGDTITLAPFSSSAIPIEVTLTKGGRDMPFYIPVLFRLESPDKSKEIGMQEVLFRTER